MYSHLIQKATIVDGTGKEPWVGDIAIEDDTIVEIAPHIDANAHTVISAQGLLVTPGFIDIQNHSDSYWQVFDNPELTAQLVQGYTTVLLGQCGASLAPLLSPQSILAMQKWHTLSGTNINWTSFDEFAHDFSKRLFGTNIASLVGYSTLRRGIIGDEIRSLTQSETQALQRILWESLEAGAFGLSTGLSYAHEIIISELELYELAQIVAKFDALLSVHMRSESSEVVESLMEAIDLAAHTDVQLKISHFKLKQMANWHHFDDAIDTIERAYHRGVRIGFDVYPYDRIWQPLYTYLPKWAVEGGRAATLQYLQSPVQRKKILAAMSVNPPTFSEMIIASTGHPLSIHGKTIGSIARNMGVSSEQAVLEILATGGTEVLVFDNCLSPDQVAELVYHPLSYIATDGAGFPLRPSGGGLSNRLVHPRCFGSAPTFLQMALESKRISLAEAVRKLTGAPAEKMGLAHRGTLEVGNFADIVVCDPQKIQAKATYKNPYAAGEGIALVMVNGAIAVQEGKVLGNFGTFIRKQK